MVGSEKPLGILAHRLPGPFVEGSHGAHHPYSIEVFQVQQVVQRPVQVVGQVGDLLPQRVRRVPHHAAHLLRGISSTAPRRDSVRSPEPVKSPAPANPLPASTPAPANWTSNSASRPSPPSKPAGSTTGAEAGA